MKLYCALEGFMLLGLSSGGLFSIVEEPEDSFVLLRTNSSAQFLCLDNEASFPPLWNISGYIYYSLNLPTKYSFYNNMLEVSRIARNDDESTYQCIFDSIHYSSLSRIATLNVYKGNLS